MRLSAAPVCWREWGSGTVIELATATGEGGKGRSARVRLERVQATGRSRAEPGWRVGFGTGVLCEAHTMRVCFADMVQMGSGSLRLLALLLLQAAELSGLSPGQLLPHGEWAGDQLLEPGDDASSEAMRLSQALHLFDSTVKNLYVNTNGIIAISKPPKEVNFVDTFPPRFGSIAPFLADLDTSDEVGKVYYRQDSSPQILKHVAQMINQGFSDFSFQPVNVFIATWVNVSAHNDFRQGDQQLIKRNTFQVALASDESSSYAVLLYPEGGLQFYSTRPKAANNIDLDLPARVGFSSGERSSILSTREGPSYAVASSSEQSVKNLYQDGNSGERGVWIFQLGSSSNHTILPASGRALHLDDSVLNTFSTATTVDHGKSYFLDVIENGTDQDDDSPEEEQKVESVVNQRTIPQQNREAPHFVEPGPVIIARPVQHLMQKIVMKWSETDVTGNVFSYNTERELTCSNNHHTCSPHGFCRDYVTGFCCHCNSGYYGNGIQCVAEGTPQRVNGKVNGKIFVGVNPMPVQFENIDLHSYVVVNDGRSYTAVSRIPATVGWAMLPLSAVGSIIGWMFALEQPNFENGFSIVGGEFTRQAEVTFSPGNEKLSITQHFSGIDEHNHLTIATKLEGQVPEIPQESTVHIEPYSELYHYSSSVIRSSSNIKYIVELPDQSSRSYSFQLKQTITFQGCINDDGQQLVPATQQLSVDRTFVLYDKNEQILRYAMSNKIGPVQDDSSSTNQNPCYTGNHGCDTNAICRPKQGNQFTCECSAGFRGNGLTCYDVDECRENPSICGNYAICNNQPGTYRCECFSGYQFADDGRTCVAIQRPENPCQAGTHDCDSPERAGCFYTGGSDYTCVCLPGFSGDGKSCVDIDECQPSRCHPYAQCFNVPGSFRCHCAPGYQGDGFQCSASGSQKTCERHRENVLSTIAPRGPRPFDQYVPQCDSQGNYLPVQCHQTQHSCWCVDSNGREITGTRSGPGIRPPCLSTVTPPVTVGPTARPDVIPLPPGTHLLFAQNGKIDHIPIDGFSLKQSEARTLLHIPDRVVIGVAYDCLDKMVYWTDIAGRAISRASLQGGEPTTIIATGLESPEGIAIDHLGRNIFWTDSGLDRIEVAKMDGDQRRVLFSDELVNPRAIVADPVHGNLYWTDWNRAAPKIETSYMDGTNRRVLVKDDLGLPNGLTYDPYTAVLCWADAGTQRLECINPDRSGRRRILQGIRYPFGITSYGRYLYYTDWKRDAVVAVDRIIGRETDEERPTRRSRLYGITTAYSRCPQGQNHCAVNNGGCTHLCLATPWSRSCLCPDSTLSVSCLESN
ncbi:nidogen-1 [Hypanus sabinus]|uniref:nidogen-1 n=1 Tax=Hypanus sabinus TaxID=79690 RepID=UPI0028C3B781|nr:nidogen-1 [Hypanus sabinus]